MTATIPATWQPNSASAFYNWMYKIKSNHYSDTEQMDFAVNKMNEK
jgi:hypothetical protein